MTPSDRMLDPDLVLDPRPLLLYRLTRTRFANLSGIGAALVNGRWNALGEEAIYTSVESSLTVLERLVHTPKDRIPSDLALMTIRIEGDWTRTDLTLKHGETEIRAFPSISSAELYFVARASAPTFRMPFAVAVPSVIVPSWNVVLYPQAPGFWSYVSLQSVEPFVFDSRLFPDNIVP